MAGVLWQSTDRLGSDRQRNSEQRTQASGNRSQISHSTRTHDKPFATPNPTEGADRSPRVWVPPSRRKDLENGINKPLITRSNPSERRIHRSVTMSPFMTLVMMLSVALYYNDSVSPRGCMTIIGTNSTKSCPEAVNSVSACPTSAHKDRVERPGCQRAPPRCDLGSGLSEEYGLDH